LTAPTTRRYLQRVIRTFPVRRREGAADEERKSVCAHGVFLATHTGPGGPCAPTGKSVKTDYVYVMEFEGDKIRHMAKIWHSGLALKQLGWA